jgi:UPF0716 protein FxsA
MLFYLFMLLIALPLTEILILIKIGQATALWVPIAIVLVTGVVGSALARAQGLKVVNRIREEMQAGHMPANAVIDAFLVLLAGILFVLPGVLTDIVGIALLFPPSRELIKRGVRAWIRRHVEVRIGRIGQRGWSTSDGSSMSDHDRIVDARVVRTRVEDAK